jgi:Uncharacterized iron-regulated protein
VGHQFQGQYHKAQGFHLPLNKILTAKSSVLRQQQTNDNEGLPESSLPSRREAIKSVSNAVLSTSLLTVATDDADALNFNPFLPPDQVSNGGKYEQAKRATAYLVDSTIPPTLIPFRAAREAAVLKNLGNGLGTQKTPFIEESLNLNNIMNKGVFGAIDFVQGIVQTDNGDGVSRTEKGKKAYDASCVFMGVDYKDQSDSMLAISIMSDIVKPRRGLDTALALEFIPISLQSTLDQYLTSSKPDADKVLVEALVTEGEVSRDIVETQLPLLQFAKMKQLSLIACKPQPLDIQVVRKEGLQNVNQERRVDYVMDTQGFIEWTQEPKNRMYSEKSLLKDFEPADEKDTPGNFFAERILVHEAVASAIARYAVRHPKTLIMAIAPLRDVRFFGGPNGRVVRICKKINPQMVIDEEAVTTILINPSAEETLSQSRFLRLEIGTKPELLQYQTKVADYLWFSSMPKVNMLPRLMNGS